MQPASSYEIVFQNQTDEAEGPIRHVEGVIPPELNGALLSMGPGYQTLGNDPLHYYDGLPMVSGVGFRNGQAYLRSRHVRTPLFEKETKAGRQTDRRALTQRPGGRLKNLGSSITDPTSHDVYAWGGRIYASGNGSHYALDPLTFDTIGPERWGLPPNDLLCLMPRPDLELGRLVVFGVAQGPFGRAKLTFFELDAAMRIHRPVSVALRESISFFHDLAFTPNWYLMIQNPLRMRVGAMLTGETSPIECFRWLEHGPVLTLVPRAGGKAIEVELPAPLKLIFHFINAYEEDGQLIVDVVGENGTIDFMSAAPPALLRRHGKVAAKVPDISTVRCVIDPRSGALLRWHAIEGGGGEQPEVDPARHGKRYRFGYVRAAAAVGDELCANDPLFYHGVAKIDHDGPTVSTWSAGPRGLASHPAFIARAGATSEDDGWLMTWVLDMDTATTSVVILDARDLARPPVATIHLNHRVPLPGHTRYEPGVSLFGSAS
ncbi:MAG: carotenoid oxygenase family protein [Archangium sp.]|nr:carotenoid oxygenase family protein [Archangium sp.]